LHHQLVVVRQGQIAVDGHLGRGCLRAEVQRDVLAGGIDVAGIAAALRVDPAAADDGQQIERFLDRAVGTRLRAGGGDVQVREVANEADRAAIGIANMKPRGVVDEACPAAADGAADASGIGCDRGTRRVAPPVARGVERSRRQIDHFAAKR